MCCSKGKKQCHNFRKKMKKTFGWILKAMFGESLLILGVKENILIPWRFEQIGEFSLPLRCSH